MRSAPKAASTPSSSAAIAASSPLARPRNHSGPLAVVRNQPGMPGSRARSVSSSALRARALGLPLSSSRAISTKSAQCISHRLEKGTITCSSISCWRSASSCASASAAARLSAATDR